VLYRPDDFDPDRGYPVLDYIYNGPQITWVPYTYNAFQHSVCRRYAGLGFVVLIVDGRGTTERGKAFQDFVHGNFGRYEIPDHVAAIRQLAAERPWMDLDRVGVTGGSFGGYMTLRAMLMAPDFYRVGVSVAPIAALEDVVAAGAESYMGLPADDPEGYEYASCLNKADRLEGQLLIIHGSADVNAPFGSTVKMVDALVRAGKDFEFVMLPDQAHWPTGSYGSHVDRVTREFLVEHLEP
jgi:dipeptidyl aminopeptidase/acylaminoacyl peptidase